ncbi:hypothetical protein ml_444 [Mollivirus sibericum]|uniref:hypothetical protein n=1 Tax=Mollivirus sibericum TaxID=1678078 RepID=UPI0006B2DD6F|nr:hypothetical protein ml_444 [Mollivirus sibericum]ALD62246.1 hypothetical protein ml_444 [Mollivirus sibericum]
MDHHHRHQDRGQAHPAPGLSMSRRQQSLPMDITVDDDDECRRAPLGCGDIVEIAWGRSRGLRVVFGILTGESSAIVVDPDIRSAVARWNVINVALDDLRRDLKHFSMVNHLWHNDRASNGALQRLALANGLVNKALPDEIWLPAVMDALGVKEKEARRWPQTVCAETRRAVSLSFVDWLCWKESEPTMNNLISLSPPSRSIALGTACATAGALVVGSASSLMLFGLGTCTAVGALAGYLWTPPPPNSS